MGKNEVTMTGFCVAEVGVFFSHILHPVSKRAHTTISQIREIFFIEEKIENKL